jgi:hypothetical protein
MVSVRACAIYPKVIVTAPDAASKNTLSAVVGTDWPPAPPEVLDQLAVFDASQVPDPPTQYLFAI